MLSPCVEYEKQHNPANYHDTEDKFAELTTAELDVNCPEVNMMVKLLDLLRVVDISLAVWHVLDMSEIDQ